MVHRNVIALVLLLTGVACAATAAPATEVSYPEGYRSWTHVKSMWLGAEHGLAVPFQGLHHIYVNPKGESALMSGKPLPDGSVLVFDLLQGEVRDHAIVEGERSFVGVMQKNGKTWSTTGGWGFDVFPGNSKTERAVSDGGAGCFGCHEAKKGNDYVFTEWRP